MRDVRVRRHARRRIDKRYTVFAPEQFDMLGRVAAYGPFTRQEAESFARSTDGAKIVRPTNSVAKFIHSLPEAWEVPRVTSTQLRRLYTDFVRYGQVDKELLDEVESRLLARAALWLSFHHFQPPEKDFELWEEASRGLEHKYELVLSGGGYGSIHNTERAYEEMLKARASGDQKKRMLAIDWSRRSTPAGLWPERMSKAGRSF